MLKCPVSLLALVLTLCLLGQVHSDASLGLTVLDDVAVKATSDSLDYVQIVQPLSAADSRMGQIMHADGHWMAVGDTDNQQWSLHTTLSLPDWLCADSDCSSTAVEYASEVSVSGNMLAVSAYSTYTATGNGGSVLIYHFVSGEWVFVHQIDSIESSMPNFGHNLSLCPYGVSATTDDYDNDLYDLGLWFCPYSAETGWGALVEILSIDWSVSSVAYASGWMAFRTDYEEPSDWCDDCETQYEECATECEGTDWCDECTEDKADCDSTCRVRPDCPDGSASEPWCPDWEYDPFVGVYDVSASDWYLNDLVLVTELRGSTDQAKNSYGGSLAFDMDSGDYGLLAVSESGWNNGSIVDFYGAAYVYAVDAAGTTWDLEQLLSDPTPTTRDYFANWLDLRDDTIAMYSSKTDSVALMCRDSGDTDAPWDTTIRRASGSFNDSAYIGRDISMTSTGVVFSSYDASLVESTEGGDALVDPEVTKVGGVYVFQHTPLAPVEAVLSLPSITSSCGTQEYTFTLTQSGETLAYDYSHNLTLGWDDVPDASLVPVFDYTDSTYTIDLVAPSSLGTSTLYLWMSEVELDTAEVTITDGASLSMDMTVMTLQGYSLPDTDVVVGMVPKDDCGATLQDTLVTFVVTTIDDVVIDTQSDIGQFTTWESLVNMSIEGRYTVTGYVDDVALDSAAIDIADIGVTIDAETVGVSSTLSTLTGLPTVTEDEYTATLQIVDVGGEVVESDVSPVMSWGGVYVPLTWTPATSTYTYTGTEVSDPAAYNVSVTVDGLELMSETVDTVYDISIDDLTVPVDATCGTGVGTFSLLKGGAAYTSDMSLTLTASWEDNTTVPVVYVDADGSYTLDLTAPASAGTHTLTVYLDSEDIASESVVLAQVMSESSAFSLPASATVDSTFAVSVTPVDACGAAMPDLTLLISTSDASGAVVDTQTVDATDSFILSTSISEEGVYTVDVTADSLIVFSDSIEIAPVFVTVGAESVALSMTLSTISTLPTETEASYSADLVLRDIDGATIDTDLSPVVTLGGTILSTVWDSTNSLYTVSGVSSSVAGSSLLTVTVGGTTLLSRTATLVDSSSSSSIGGYVVVGLVGVAASIGTFAVGRMTSFGPFRAPSASQNPKKDVAFDANASSAQLLSPGSLGMVQPVNVVPMGAVGTVVPVVQPMPLVQEVQVSVDSV
ncbi:hypothetical protein KIPB_002636 [Kipferlia bialata]|uniref:Uncharacterized protein n=1 Tax=Kipferlia bialata TaxID=797122 RepID=A0A9K3CRR5_9EUKA|nr:hypothetical protein KIPB_002636 [Kipferlia bialata]|eukprot:g2636.t1